MAVAAGCGSHSSTPTARTLTAAELRADARRFCSRAVQSSATLFAHFGSGALTTGDLTRYLTSLSHATAGIDTYLNTLHGPATITTDVRKLTSDSAHAIATERAIGRQLAQSKTPRTLSASAAAKFEAALQNATGQGVATAGTDDLPSLCAPVP